MLNTLPVLPMLKMLPLLPMLRMLPALPMLSRLPALARLRTLAKQYILRMLRKLPMLCMLARELVDRSIPRVTRSRNGMRLMRISFVFALRLCVPSSCPETITIALLWMRHKGDAEHEA